MMFCARKQQSMGTAELSVAPVNTAHHVHQALCQACLSNSADLYTCMAGCHVERLQVAAQVAVQILEHQVHVRAVDRGDDVNQPAGSAAPAAWARDRAVHDMHGEMHALLWLPQLSRS